MSRYSFLLEKTFEEVGVWVTAAYLQSEGEKKATKIIEKVKTSDKLSGLINTSRYRHVAPNDVDVLSALLIIPFFAFRSNLTHLFAATCFYVRWNEEVNNQLHILSDEELVRYMVRCIERYM